MKIVLGVFGAALLVLAGAVGGYVLRGDDDSDGGTALPRGWAVCSNPGRGFAIGHPARWHTDHVAAEESCEFFDPEPFQVPRQSDIADIALEIDPGRGRFDDAVDGLTDRQVARVLGRKETTIAGRSAVRIETEAHARGFDERGTKVTSWVVDRDGRGFVVRTIGFPGSTDYASRQRVLDRAVRTLTFFQPTAAELADGRLLPAQRALSDAAERKRLAIARAAAARDFDALERLLPERGGFEYTYGGTVPGGPSAYWRRLEATTDEAPLESLVAILSLPYTRVRGLYVWPFAFDRDPKQWSEEELGLLSTFATPRDIQGWREFGSYIGWRTGIEPDGDWVFYVAGD